MPQQQPTIEQQAEALESYALNAAARAVSRVALMDSLRASLGAQLGAVLGNDLIAAHDAADRELQPYARAIRALQQGRAKLARWKDKNGALVWGVVAVDGALGIWPFVAAVLVVTAAGAGWYLLYLHLTAKKVESTARQLRAQTAAKCQETVTKLTAAGRLDEAAQLGMACAAAGQAADAPPAGTLDRIADGLFKIGAGLAGAGLGIGALLGLALLFRSSRKSGGKSSSAGKRLRWHRPVSFHRPVSYE